MSNSKRRLAFMSVGFFVIIYFFQFGFLIKKEFNIRHSKTGETSMTAMVVNYSQRERHMLFFSNLLVGNPHSLDLLVNNISNSGKINTPIILNLRNESSGEVIDLQGNISIVRNINRGSNSYSLNVIATDVFLKSVNYSIILKYEICENLNSCQMHENTTKIEFTEKKKFISYTLYQAVGI